MTYLVTGASGMLGRAVRKEFAAWADGRVVGLCRTRTAPGLVPCDLTDAAAVARLLDDVRPDVIVHTAAIRRPDDYAADPAAARRLNVDATTALADWAARRGACLLYISSDYVFDGTRAPYRPDDPPAPANAYGASKLAGEEAVLRSGAAAAVLRVPVLFTDTPEALAESSVTSVAEKVLALKDGRAATCALDDWAIRYPTRVENIAEVLAQMARGRRTGIFHWSSEESFTKYGMGRVAAELLGVDPARLTGVATPANGTEPRPRDCHLDRSRLVALGVRATEVPFRTALARALAHVHPARA